MSPRRTARRRVAGVAGTLLLALVLTLGSCGVQRLGPEQAAYGNLCGPSMDQLCMRPRLNGGWPLGYMFDTPGVSVEGSLAWPDDPVRTIPFLVDLAFFWAVLAAAAMLLSWGLRRNARRA